MKSILPTANAFMTLLIFACAIKTGSFRNLNNVDISCFFIGVIASVIWWITKSLNITQILLQVSILIGFIPTWKNVYTTPDSELLISWLLWTLCFLFHFIAIKKTWSGKYIELLYPTNMFFCHGIVLIMILR